MLAVFRQRVASFSFYRISTRAKLSKRGASATFELAPFRGPTKKFALCYFASELYHNGYVINAPSGPQPSVGVSLGARVGREPSGGGERWKRDQSPPPRRRPTRRSRRRCATPARSASGS